MTMCAACHGDVRNVPGRRLTIEQLFAVHDVSCPAPTPRRRKPAEPEANVS